MDVRVVCATHQDLKNLIAEGRFREDLYYRLAEIVVNIPPLRARNGDAVLLADVGEFMTLQPGDVLMVGTDCLADGARPRAKAGDRVEISALGLASVVTNVGAAA